MPKKHHPKNRLERLKLKEQFEETKDKTGRVRKRLIAEQVKEQETEDEIREWRT